MKKVLIALGVIVLGVVSYVAIKPNDTSVKNNTQEKSFLDFVNSKGSFECTVTQNVQGISSKGTVFISEGKIRGEFQTETQGMKINSSMVVKDGYTYSWTSMMPNTVYKVKAVEQTSSNNSVSTSGTYSFDAKQIGAYECKDWNLDAAKFELPKDAKVMDIGAMTQNIPNTQVTKPASQTVTEPKAPATSEKTFTMAEVQAHATDKSCYSVVNGNVYDLTSYIYKHKGGASKILKICGKDGTSLFEGQHGGQTKPEAMLASLKIGVLK